MYIDLKPSKNLIKLAKGFKKNGSLLFIVGGSVRNFILGIELSDIDICGNMPYEKAIEVATKLGFNAKVINKKLGTVLISVENEEYEYTCFRKENYSKGGAHSPNEVQFISSVEIDASRRDFTVNALYYDILTNEVVDFYNGVNDAKNKVIRCIRTPKEVFENDGLRILRMIRFASELGFKIDSKTFNYAKRMKYQIRDISKERIIKELKKISISDMKYNTKNIDFINILNKMKLWGVLINNYFENVKIKLNKKEKISYLSLSENERYVGLMLLLLKSFYRGRHASFDEISCSCYIIFGDSGMKESKTNINAFISGYNVFQYFTNKMEITNKLIIDYYNLKDFVREILLKLDYNNARKLEFEINKCEELNIPLALTQLKITNTELLENSGVPYKQINSVKVKLFNACLDEKIKNEPDELIEYAKSLIIK